MYINRSKTSNTYNGYFLNYIISRNCSLDKYIIYDKIGENLKYLLEFIFERLRVETKRILSNRAGVVWFDLVFPLVPTNYLQFSTRDHINMLFIKVFFFSNKCWINKQQASTYIYVDSDKIWQTIIST